MQRQKKKRRKKEIKMTENIFFISMEFLSCFSDVILRGFWWCGKIVVVFTGLEQMG